MKKGFFLENGGFRNKAWGGPGAPKGPFSIRFFIENGPFGAPGGTQDFGVD